MVTEFRSNNEWVYCDNCGQETEHYVHVSTSAIAKVVRKCSVCGNRIEGLLSEHGKTSRKTHSNYGKSKTKKKDDALANSILAGFVLVIIGVPVVGGYFLWTWVTGAFNHEPTACEKNWRDCDSRSAIIDAHESDAFAACRTRTWNRARGEVDFEYLGFSARMPDKESGILVVRTDAELENGLGNMVPRTIRCEYDLNSEMLLGFEIR